MSYIYVFLQSNLIEIPIYFIFYRKHLSPAKIAILVTLANSITHPLVFFGFMASTSLSYLTAILLAETFAVTSEAALHYLSVPQTSDHALPWKNTLTAACAANLVSWQLAPMLTYWFFLS